MFGWFSPTCPVDDAAKQWIESRLRWLATQFGLDVLTRRAIILPTSDFFPNPIDGSKASVYNLLGQVCRYMDVDPDLVDLEFIEVKPDLWVVNDDGKYLPPQVPVGFMTSNLGEPSFISQPRRCSIFLVWSVRWHTNWPTCD